MAGTPTASSTVIDQTWESIDRLADEAAAFSEKDISEGEFYTQLLNRLVSALAAVAAVVWKCEKEGRLVLGHQTNLAGTPLAEDINRTSHLLLLESVRQGDEPRMALPRSGSQADGQPANPTDLLLLVCPVRIDDRTIGIVEIFQRPTTDPDVQQACLGLLSALCEAASDFHRNSELRALRRQRTFWEQSEESARRIHSSIGLRQTAYAIVNESRLLVDCDRASVAVRRGSGCAILAASGVDRVQRRSVSVRLLERLSALVLATGEMLWYDGGSENLPPEFDRVLQPYLDESHVRLLGIVPLGCDEPDETTETAASQASGVLIVEQFDAEWDDELRQRLSTVCTHSELALSNALRYRSPLRRAADWLAQGGTSVKLAAILLIVAVATAALVVVPADFDIESRGELLPEKRQDVFAPVSGDVRELSVEHNSAVTDDQTLLVMTSSDLKLEHERLLGEQRTTQQKLLAAQSERVRKNQPGAEDRRRSSSWSAIEKELEEQLQSVNAQLAVVATQMEKLNVRSPMEGRVQTWDVRQLLESRPVERGQVLLTVADVQGPWVLELKVPDHHVTHVLAAQEANGPDLDVRFILKTDPDVTYQGTMALISSRTTPDEDGSAYVKAVVTIDRDKVAPLQYGSAVLAKVHCGRRSVGYVWLHDLIDAIKTWVLL